MLKKGVENDLIKTRANLNCKAASLYRTFDKLIILVQFKWQSLPMKSLNAREKCGNEVKKGK